MKISKLFHWLYASVMLLPLFAIGVTCLYTIFNKNAKDSYYGSTINESEVVNVNSANLEVNRQYTYNSVSPISYVGTNTFTINVRDFERTYPSHSADYSSVNRLVFRPTNNAYYVFLYRDNTYVSDTNLTDGFVNLSFTFISSVGTLESDYQFFSTILYNKDSFLDNSFYYSTRLLKESNYFNWAKDSFLSQPITYITGLFGMDNDNIVIYLLSYWLDISIIWLTFDLVMYVPLLVHRWLDKGVLE